MGAWLREIDNGASSNEENHEHAVAEELITILEEL